MQCKKCKKVIPEGSTFCLHCGTKQVRAKSHRSRPNGTGTAYKRGKSWTAACVVGWKSIDIDGDKRKVTPIWARKGGFESKTKALEFIPQLFAQHHEAHMDQTTHSPIPQDTVTLSSLWRVYEMGAYEKLSKDKKKGYRKAYERLEDAKIVDIDLRAMTIEILQEAVNTQATTYYTRKDMRTVVSLLYQRAMAQQTVSSNIAPFIELPELVAKEGVPFTSEEQNSLWESYANGLTFSGYILLMIYTGAMPGEILKIERRMVNWEKQEIWGAGIKTKERQKHPIVVPDIVIPILKELLEASSSDKLWPLSKDAFYERFYATIEICKCRRLTPYSCRHTTGTALALKDIPKAIAQKIMRNDFNTMHKFYTHINGADALEAANKLFTKENSEESSDGSDDQK